MKWIDELVVGIHETYYTSCPYELCRTLNIQIIYTNQCNTILNNNDSTYIRNLFGQETIFMRNDLDYKYEKFILAHELGHALVHTHVYKTYCNKNLINKDKIERQANYFAFKFLNIKIDPVECEGLTIEQISHSLHIPLKHLKEVL